MRDGTAFDGVETQEWFSSLRIDWDIGGSGWYLTSTSGHRDYVNLFGTDSDHSDAFAIGGIPSFFPPPPRPIGYAGGEPLFANTNRNDIIDYSSELRLASPADRRLRGAIGVCYYNQQDEGRDLTFDDPQRAELENESFTEGCDDFEYTLETGRVIDFDNLTPEARAACDISGNRLPLGSEHQANASLDWTVPITSSLAFVSNLNATYESSKFVQVHNLAETGDATIVGLRLGLRSDAGWQITTWGRNLTDEDTIPLATRWFDLRHGFAHTAPPGTAGSAPGLLDSGLPRAFFGALRKGRTFGIDVRYDF